MKKKIIAVTAAVVVAAAIATPLTLIGPPKYKPLIEGIGFSNPAVVYCQEMGYKYEVVNTDDGERSIVTFPDGTECDAWAFYKGECGEEFSYCVRNGWQVAPIGKADNLAERCITCILPNGSRSTVATLLDLNRKSRRETTMIDIDNYRVSSSDTSLPSHFDWRDNGGNWLSPVKDQGGCGSCWAFAVVGAVEAQYNIISGNPDLDLDLSEQNLVSYCCADCGSCWGGWSEVASRFMRDEGITDEPCFPYIASSSPCSDRCADWSSRLIYIDALEGVPRGDEEAMKEYLIEKGPLVAHLGMGESRGAYWDGDIYRCVRDAGINHAVVIVGYDEVEDYWITRNSWGSDWNGDGYFKVGFGECAIQFYVSYNTVLPLPTPTGCFWTFPWGIDEDPTAAFSRYLGQPQADLEIQGCAGPIALPTGGEPSGLLVVWLYDEIIGEWTYWIPGYGGDLTQLESNRGYWVVMEGGGVYTWNLMP